MSDKNKAATSGAESSSTGSSRPTLFNLLEVLANYSMTTPSQRQCIRDIVTEFLANKFEHSKVYSYIGAVVGHDRLHTVIKQLEADPDRSPLPDQDGLMRIESAFNLTRNYKNQNGTNGDTNSSNKDEILRSIRRNLSKKCELTRSSSVRTASAGVLLQKACWLPIRRTLTAGPLYGHSLICIGNRAYILGGSNGRNQGFNLSKAHVINLLDFSSKQIMLSGEVPSHREGNSCNVAVLHQTHAVVLFGGFNGEVFFNDVYLLDLEKRRWTKRNPSGRLPTPRDEHSALIYPPRCDLKNVNPVTSSNNVSNPPNGNNNTNNTPSNDTNKEQNTATLAQAVSSSVVYLFVFGGKTGSRNQFQCLNDMWAYNVLSNYWTLVETGENKPSPRFGVCALWADDETVCVFGGETSSSTGYVDRTERVLLDDLWMFRLTSFPSKAQGVTETESGSNETQKEPETKPEKLSGMWLQDYYEGNIGPRSHYSSIFIAQRCKELTTGTPRTIERLMFLTGGLTYAPGNKKVVVASDKLYFYFFSQKRWYSLKPNYPRNYIGEPFEPRQLHVACFFEKKNILFPGTKPSVPCIFFHGGFHKKQILSDSWVLSLTGEDLFFKNSLLSPETNNTNKMELRMYPPWYYRESHSPSLLWGVASVQKWVFGALAHLVDNSLKESVSSSNLSVKFESSPRGEELMLSVQDDGNGLDYNSMNRLLKLFGKSYSNYNASEDSEVNKHEYGLGFKLAYGRLGNSVAVMSRTHDSIGIGMLSLELMCQCESREMAAPMCMWKLPSKELINRDGPCLIDQRHHQRLLMTYSPFNSASLLAEQINVLGVNPGTRLLFWQLRDDLDSVALEDGTLFDSTTSHHTHVHDLEDDHHGHDHEHEEEGNVVYLREHFMEGGIVMSTDHMEDEQGENGHMELVDEKGEKHEECTNPAHKNLGHHYHKDCGGHGKHKADHHHTHEEAEELKNLFGYYGSWYDVFPLWKKSKHSMDYCLPVYLYWLHLHSSCALTVQDVQLKPNSVHDHLFDDKKSQSNMDDMENTTVTGQSVFDPDQSNYKRAREYFSPSSEVEDLPTKKSSFEGSEADNVKVDKPTEKDPKDVKEKEEVKTEEEKKDKKVFKLLGTSFSSASSTSQGVGGGSTGSPSEGLPPVGLGTVQESREDCFLDLHSHVFNPQAINSGFGMDDYSCGKNTCGYCGVSPIGRSLSGGQTLYSFLKAKLHKSVQLPFLFHPDDHAQGCFALIGFLNDPTSVMYLSSSGGLRGFSLERESSGSVTSGSSNVGGLPSPTNRPLAPTSFHVTEPKAPQPPSTPVTESGPNASNSQTMSPTKGRKGKGQRGRPAASEKVGSQATTQNPPSTSPTETDKKGEQKQKSSTSTQVIYSGGMSDTIEVTATDPKTPTDEGKFSMFAGVGAGAQLKSSTSPSTTSNTKSSPSPLPRSSSFFSKQYQSAKTALEDRVCEAGVLLYYKGRLIRRLEGTFPAPPDELESARLPPKPSLFKGHMYRFALTAVVSVPAWLVPSITKQEFLHENNRVFLMFKHKLIKMLSEYCKVCLDEHTRSGWYLDRMKQILDYDLAHQKHLYTFMTRDKDETEGVDDELVPSWKMNSLEPFQDPSLQPFQGNNTQNVTTKERDDDSASSSTQQTNNQTSTST